MISESFQFTQTTFASSIVNVQNVTHEFFQIQRIIITLVFFLFHWQIFGEVWSSDVIKTFFQDQDQDLNFKTKTKTLKFFQDQDQA